MRKMWNVDIEGITYNIELKNRKVQINGDEIKLKANLIKHGCFYREYKLPIGDKAALLVIGSLVAGPHLIIDGRDCSTGAVYTPFILPKWSNLFMVIHALNLMNGAIGALLAIAGVTMTAHISSSAKLNIVLKILLDFLILIISAAIIFSVAYLIAMIR